MYRIYVNLCSYRDNFLAATVDSLLSSQSGRNKIIIGIFEQNSIENSLNTLRPDLVSNPNIRYKRIDHQYSDGVVWARAINSMQIEDEDFFYQIDSHMLFDKNWDHHLILDYLQASKIENSKKIILTSGTKNFDFKLGKIIKTVSDDDIAVDIKFFQFADDLRIHAHGHRVPKLKKVKKALHILAGNFFTTKEWLKDVGYNTNIFFFGEEQILTLNSWLADYKIYLQRSTKVYHYIHSGKHTSKHENNKDISDIDLIKIKEREQKTNYEISKLIYSLDEELLEKLKNDLGVDYINRKIAPFAISKIWNSKLEKQDWE